MSVVPFDFRIIFVCAATKLSALLVNAAAGLNVMVASFVSVFVVNPVKLRLIAARSMVTVLFAVLAELIGNDQPVEVSALFGVTDMTERSPEVTGKVSRSDNEEMATLPVLTVMSTAVFWLRGSVELAGLSLTFPTPPATYASA